MTNQYFTGIPGSPNANYGNFVLGSLENYGATGASLVVHQLSGPRFRVLFAGPVTSSALSPSRYTLASLAAPGTAATPSIRSVSFYDESRTSVVVELFNPLTTGTDYSVEVDDVWTDSGFQIRNMSRNFTANVVVPSIAVGAFQSKRGMVDILFDRDVGPGSGAAAFSIRDAAGGPSVPMVQAVWAPENISPRTLRVQLPAGMPTADAFIIEFSGVVDDSMNPSSGSVPLTLALRGPAPYSYADLLQLQITDAFVTDVSGDFLQTANVRVFFNGPVQDAQDVLNWTASAASAHRSLDTVNSVTAPDAVDLPTLVALANQFKAVFNAHLAAETVHFASAVADIVTAPDASDLPTACALVNQAQEKMRDHFLRSAVHLYQDTVHSFQFFDTTGNQALAMAVANLTLKAKFNGHVAASYPLQFSFGYQYLGQVQSFAFSTSYPVRGPYTYFAEIRVLLDQAEAPVLVTAGVTSEDGLSTTNPAALSGSVEARAWSSPATVRSVLVAPETSVEIRLDREMGLRSPGLEVSGPSGPVRSSASVRTSLQAAVWAYNNAVTALLWHIANLNIHRVHDPEIINSADMATSDVPASIPVVNGLRARLVAHMSSGVYHYSPDFNLPSVPDATDEESLIRLMVAVRDAVAGHDVIVGPHSSQGYRVVSAPANDVILVGTRFMTAGGEHRVSGPVGDLYVDSGVYLPVPVPPVVRTHEGRLSVAFTGLAQRPSLASALPRQGLSFSSSGFRLEADAVEVYFSKPMAMVALDSSNLQLTGGSIIQGATSWTGPDTAEAAVQRMEPVVYSVSASGLTDEAGNPIYP